MPEYIHQKNNYLWVRLRMLRISTGSLSGSYNKVKLLLAKSEASRGTHKTLTLFCQCPGQKTDHEIQPLHVSARKL